MKEQISQQYSAQHAEEICQQSRGQCITGMLYINGAKIHGQYVECSFGGALDNAGQLAHKGIGAVRLENVYHQRPGAAAAQRLHEGHR